MKTRLLHFLFAFLLLNPMLSAKASLCEGRWVNPVPDSNQCHPTGRSVIRWQTGKEMPNTKKNYGYLVWKKRNCVVL